jgi:hypothetical protein
LENSSPVLWVLADAKENYNMDRRRLLQSLSLSMLSSQFFSVSPSQGQTAEKQEPQRPAGATNRVNIGVIGPGSRGKELIRQLLRTPGVEIAAVCDVYEPRFAEVNELVGKKYPGIRMVTNFWSVKT